ncbi:amino acid adenylation domain-containing protein [Lysinibacillus sp. NPDC059133]|uniref:amino acid adenylation domain-containing protein n=1 Tax=Lysinibacillus sp. NPDC059133 TaxID=3346737 RepID=UPI0036A98FFA
MSEQYTFEQNELIIEASPEQKRLWFFTELVPDVPVYNVYYTFHIKGNLLIDILEESVNLLVKRHESLRTNFKVIDGKLMQVIMPNKFIPIHYMDINEDLKYEEDQEKVVLNCIENEVRHRFQLENGQLLKLSLLEIQNDEFILIINMHHIISDGWSIDIFSKEFSKVYHSLKRGEDPTLNELFIQYADYSEWERQQDFNFDEQLDYWTHKLNGASPLLELPTDKVRPSVQSFSGSQYDFEIPYELLKSIKKMSKQEGTTLFTTLLAVYKVLLFRYSGQEDILVGTPIANRNHNEIENIMGMFANSLVLRTEINPNWTFIDLLENLKQVVLDAYDNKDINLEKIIDSLNIPRSNAYTPFFQTMFVLESSSKWELDELQITPLNVHNKTSKFDITFTINESVSSCLCSIEYYDELFEKETIIQFAQSFLVLLENVIKERNKKISQIGLVTDSQITRYNNNSDSESLLTDKYECIHNVFEEQVRRYPYKAAIKYEDNSYTYEELNQRSNQVANYLIRQGVQKNSYVGICIERSIEMVVGILGILKAGAAYVPIDPRQPHERQSFIVNDVNMKLVLTQQHLFDTFSCDIKVIALDRDVEEIEKEDNSNPDVKSESQNPAYVIYTSGSTGKPKGVIIPHRNVIRLFSSTSHWFRFNEKDVWTNYHSFSFDFSVWEIWGALLHGGKLIVVPHWISRSPKDFIDLIFKEKVSILNQTPSAFKNLMPVLLEARHPELDLRYIVFGGETLEFGDLKDWFTYYGDEHPKLINMYGITETTVHVTYFPVTKESVHLSKGSITGVPIPDLEIYVLDKFMQPVPPGVHGELYIGGEGLAEGYLNRAELTNERFIKNPFKTNGKLYKSGDIVKVTNDNNLVYIGRIDNQIKLNGYRIELGEIQKVIKDYPDIKDVLLMVYEDDESNKILVLYIVENHQVNINLLNDYIESQLPEYMVPQVIIPIDKFPLTNNGKVDIKALPSPTSHINDDTKSEVKDWSRNQIEETLVRLWAGVLKKNSVGLEDNFFELGGDSISSILIVAEGRKYGLDFSIQDLFRNRTIKNLSKLIIKNQQLQNHKVNVEEPVIESIEVKQWQNDVEDAYPLTRLQEGMLYQSELTQGSRSYINITSFKVKFPYDHEALYKSLEIMMNHHVILRTSFDLVNYNQPLQLVHKKVEPPVSTFDITEYNSIQQNELIHDWIKKEKNIQFDWGKAPLFTITIHQRNSHEFQFTLKEHHAILDGWSVANFISELFDLYQSFKNNKRVDSKKFDMNVIKKYVELETEAISSSKQLSYWLRILEDYEYKNFPKLNSQQSDEIPYNPKMTKKILISNEIFEKVKKLSKIAAVHYKAVLLSAHCSVLGLLSGKKDVLTGLVTNGRPEVTDGADFLGLFLNMTPLRVKLDRKTWIDLIKDVFDKEQDSIPYNRYPMVDLKNSVGVNRLFESTFNYIHFHVYDSLLDNQSIELWDTLDEGLTEIPFSVSFNLNPINSRLELIVEWDSSLFTAEQMELIVGYYNKSIEIMAENPYSMIKTDKLISEVEKNKILNEFSKSSGEQPTIKTSCLIHQLFEEQVKTIPKNIAVQYEKQTLTYKELNQQANRFANYLLRNGLKSGDIVGVAMERSIELIITVLGILKSGGAYVPIDPQQSTERISYILEQSNTKIIISQKEVSHVVSADDYNVKLFDEILFELFREKDTDLNLDLNLEHAAYLLYTSGSTGMPKGVLVPHRAISNHTLWKQREFPLGFQDVVLQKTAFTFDVSVSEIFAPLIAGAKLLMAKPNGHLDPEYLLDIIKNEKVTLLQVVPTMLNLLTENSVKLQSCTSLRYMLCGGEYLKLELVNRFQSLHNGQLVNLYGPTETCIDSTYWISDKNDYSNQIPIGYPVEGCDAYILDSQLGILPVGVIGELYIGGKGLAIGYINKSDLTADKFIPNPFTQDGSRLYRTGDLAKFLPDGSIEYIGRQDQQLKINGNRVEVEEIESSMKLFPGILEVVVSADKDQNDNTILVAYYVKRKSTSIFNNNEFNEFLKQRLPYYMVPSRYICLDSFPTTSSGKVDRNALPKIEHYEKISKGVFEGPKTLTEEKMLKIWSEVFKVDTININENFFDLGGHSLTAIRIVSRSREVFKKNISISSIFEIPIFKELCEYIEEETEKLQESGEIIHIEELPTNEELPLSYVQQSIWIHTQISDDPSIYNIPLIIKVNSPLRIQKLQRALDALVKRHEALRTTFVIKDNTPIQQIHEDYNVTIKCEDLSDEYYTEKDQVVKEKIKTQIWKPFSLSEGPLFRLLLVKLNKNENILIGSFHHIIFDGDSSGIFVNELFELYKSELDNNIGPYQSKALKYQYVDYAKWQRRWLTTTDSVKQLNYWKNKFMQDKTKIKLPYDFIRETEDINGRICTDILNESLSGKINSICNEHGYTRFMLFITVFKTILHYFSKQQEIIVGTPISNRNGIEFEEVIGCFINTITLCSDFSKNKPLLTLIDEIRYEFIESFRHGQIPIEKINEEFAYKKGEKDHSIFQILFAFHNDLEVVPKLKDFCIEFIEVDRRPAKFDIHFDVIQKQDTYHIHLTYNPSKFAKSTIVKMLNCYKLVINQLVDHPKVMLNDVLDALDEYENKILEERKKEIATKRILDFEKF